MLNRPDKTLRERLQRLESHLENENPLLLDAVARFKKLDRVAYKMGLLETDDSFATRIPWWPLISVLGTFSAGKSSFINQFLDRKLQLTGSQAVDDKFTVITYSAKNKTRMLPGLALDADPRFPFYQMSREIEKVSAGEGQRIDAYLQMKTSDSDKLSGKIIIDSPGFDADDQRNAILRLTDHIVELSDLVLVFFDARHPEPGAMQDTLNHLVKDTITRNDSEKFLYILNQIDTAAQEDNPEEVVAAWQRALAQKGLTAGRFYTIYNPDVAHTIHDDTVRQRFEARRDRDLMAIKDRIHQVEVERSYRIIGNLEKIADDIEKNIVPALTQVMTRWMKYVLISELVIYTSLLAFIFSTSQWLGLDALVNIDFDVHPVLSGIKLLFMTCLVIFIHFKARSIVAGRLSRGLAASLAGDVSKAFLRNTRVFRSVFLPVPAGWTSRSKKILKEVRADASEFIQSMNDRFADPLNSSSVLKASKKAELFTVVEKDNKEAG